MRKILIFSLVYYPRFIGGAEVAVKEITDQIGGDEVQFDMVTLRLDSQLPAFERIGNVNVYRVGWAAKQKDSSDSLKWYLHLNKYALPFTAFVKALSLHKKNAYDAVWSIMATYNSFAALFFKLCNPTVRFILTLQEGDPIPYIKRRALPVYPLFKMIFTKADHIQAISTYLADWAKDMGAHCPIEVIPNAVDIALFSQKISDEERVALSMSLGKQSGDVFLITTSRLVVKNAVGDIIRALSFLPVNVKLLILGQGYQEHMLKDETKRLGLTERVQFLGYVPHKEMYKYLAVSDIFVRPALSEGLGNSFLEAMCAGIPVIATPVGGIPDFLTDGQTGLFCNVADPQSIADKISVYMHDAIKRNVIVENARSMVIANYDWRLISQNMKTRIFDVV